MCAQKDDQTWGSLSWTDDFERLPAFYGSQRRTFDPIDGSTDWPLHQTFRFGTDRLRYRFPVEPGTYTYNYISLSLGTAPAAAWIAAVGGCSMLG
jgi:hypothetical protein